MGQYITGLLFEGERKSIEPIAARLVDDAAQIEAMRQRLQQCVVVSAWDEATVFARLAQIGHVSPWLGDMAMVPTPMTNAHA